MRKMIREGEYVLATKYHDGDPGDHFAVGFYGGTLASIGKPDRHMVLNSAGVPFRANGFRRVKKISTARGLYIVTHLEEIERGSHSVWWWVRCSMK